MGAERLLVTPHELSDWQRGALSVLDADADGYTDGIALRAIASAQAVLASVLGFDPFIHKTTRVRFAWRRQRACGQLPVPDEGYVASGSGGPIVVVVTDPYRPDGEAEGDFTTAISADGMAVEVLDADPLPPAADLYEGWRGSHHVLEADISPGEYETEISAIVGLEDLDVLPPEVPETLRTAICEGAVYLARRADRAGVISSELDMSAQVKRTETLASMNDVNVLIGRRPELVQLMMTYANDYRRVLA